MANHVSISDHGIHVISWNSCQIMEFMSDYGIHVICVNWIESCQIKLFMPIHVIHVTIHVVIYVQWSSNVS
jgi:hypothetical protein